MRTDLKMLLAFLLLCAPAAAQQATEADYKLMQQMMRSGNSYSQSRAQAWDARLKVLSGDVEVKTADSADWHRIKGELPLDQGDVIKTSGDGVAEMYLDDKGAFSISRNTELELSSLDQENSSISLRLGAIVAKIKHFLDEKQRFEVRTPSAVCAVRGTEFAVEYSQLDKVSSVGVFDEGRVAVTPQLDSGKAGDEVTLDKNSEIAINPAERRFHPEPLFRMGRFRCTIGQMRRRLLALRRWRPRSAAKRAQLREAALKRVVRRQLRRRSSSRVSGGAKRKARGLRPRSGRRRPRAGGRRRDEEQ